MDRADFSFLVASFLYTLLVVAERIGLILDPIILDLFARSGGFAIRLR